MKNYYEWLEDEDECLRVNEEVLIRQANGFSKQTYGISRDELIQQARIALTTARKNFKADAGSDFDSYARFIIQQALKKLRKDYKVSQSSSFLPSKENSRLAKAEKEFESETGRLPTDEELAIRAEVSLDVVRLWRSGGWRYLASMNDPVGGGESEQKIEDKLSAQALNPEMEFIEKESHVSALELLKRLEQIIELSGLTNEERRILQLRWGTDQELKPRPRAEVARVLAEGKPDSEYMVAQKNPGRRPEYITDKIRTIELRATGKIERTFRSKKREP